MSRKWPIKKQDAMIKAEMERFAELLPEISKQKQGTAVMLMEHASFMATSLQILESQLKSEGITETMKNGKQKIKIINPSLKAYNTMVARYLGTIDKIIGLMPKEVEVPSELRTGDDFDDFVQERGD